MLLRSYNYAAGNTQIRQPGVRSGKCNRTSPPLMSKNLATFCKSPSWSPSCPPLVNGAINAVFFEELQSRYRSLTGYHLVLSDTNGSIQMGLPDCEKFPCPRSCRECREKIISEALRTGKVCIDTCHEGYVLWGLPLSVEGQTLGGIIVIGGEHEQHEATDDQPSFLEACAQLYRLLQEYHLLPPGPTDSSHRSELHRFIFRKAFLRLQKEMDFHAKPLLDAWQTAEFEVAQRHFESLKQAFRENRELPTDLLRGLAGDLVCQVRRQFAESGLDAYACYAEAGLLLEKLALANTIDHFLDLLDSLNESCLRFCRQRPKDPDELMIEKATTYLEAHLREELNRDQVAKAVGLSPSHFSRLIHEKKGRTFTDLLNQYRVEHAAKLLVRTCQTLSFIAQEAGFCDQSYFSKVFRKYKGVTPAAYRQAHR